MLLKTLGKARYQEGSFSAGIQALQDFLHKIQIDDTDVVLTDGSGLSLGNSLSPRFVGQFLARMSGQANGEVFLNSLGQAGRRGLLMNHFASARQANPAIADRIRAVTGIVSSNYSFSGYAVTEGGAQFAFSFMINDPRYEAGQASALLDNLALAVANSRVSVSLPANAAAPQ
jgi:D-alanyl-D-alanine carboxypeptidase/D-alanyl-D-alanine-endopeptidase (penicillin-binding protein 4)